MVWIVSFSDSPLSTDDPEAFSDMVSADSRLAASSKLDEVRVDDSKKTFTTVRPRSVGTFLTSRASTASNEAARVEDPLDVVAAQVGHRDQVALRPAVGRRILEFAHRMVTSSTSSISIRRTKTRSAALVGRFLPT